MLPYTVPYVKDMEMIADDRRWEGSTGAKGGLAGSGTTTGAEAEDDDADAG